MSSVIDDERLAQLREVPHEHDPTARCGHGFWKMVGGRESVCKAGKQKTKKNKRDEKEEEDRKEVAEMNRYRERESPNPLAGETKDN